MDMTIDLFTVPIPKSTITKGSPTARLIMQEKFKEWGIHDWDTQECGAEHMFEIGVDLLVDGVEYATALAMFRSCSKSHPRFRVSGLPKVARRGATMSFCLKQSGLMYITVSNPR